MSNFITNLALRGAGLGPSGPSEGLRPLFSPAFPSSFTEAPEQMANQDQMTSQERMGNLERMAGQENGIMSDSAPAYIPADIGKRTAQVNAGIGDAEDYYSHRAGHEPVGHFQIPDDRAQEQGSESSLLNFQARFRPWEANKPGPGFFMEKPSPASGFSENSENQENQEYRDKYRVGLDTEKVTQSVELHESVPITPAVSELFGQTVAFKHEAFAEKLAAAENLRGKNSSESTKTKSLKFGGEDLEMVRIMPREIHQTTSSAQQKIPMQCRTRITPAPDERPDVTAPEGFSTARERQRQVTVHIGSIEVHAAREQSATRQPSPVIQQVPVNQGFSEYAAIRSYRLWRDE